MRQFCLLLIVVAWVPSAGAVAFVAAVSGDWQATATWGTSGTGCHVAYPCITDASNPGDTVSMNGKTVTCSTGETCSFGNSPSSASLTACSIAGGASMEATVNGSVLIVQSGAKFVIGGPACWSQFTTVGQIIQFLDGSTVYHDSSWATTPVGYPWYDSYTANSTTQWLIGTSAGSGATIDLDSFDAPTKNPANCTAARTSGCMSGTWGANGSFEGGVMQVYNSTFIGAGGTGTFWNLYLLNRVDANIIHSRIFYSGNFVTYTVRGTKNFNFKGNYMTAQLATYGMSQGSNSSNTGGMINLANNFWELNTVGYQPLANNYVGMLVINDVQKLPWSSGTGFVPITSATVGSNRTITSNPNTYVPVYQMLWYNDSWALGATEGSTYMCEASAIMEDSIVWTARNYGPPNHGQHLHVFCHQLSSGPAGSWVEANNVTGSMGPTNTTDYAYQQGNATGGGPTAATTFIFTGNIETCGYTGMSSANAQGHWWSNNTTNNFGSQSINNYQNTNCSVITNIHPAAADTSNAGGYGGAEFPGPTWGAPDAINFNANLFMRMDGVGTGDVPILNSYSGVSDTYFQANPPWHSANYNAVINMRTASAGIAPCAIRTGGSQNINSCLWITSGGAPTTSTEIMIPAMLPVGVDFMRTFTNFGDYLNASGLLPFSYYSTAHTIDLGYTSVTAKLSSVASGAWTSGTSYNVGDIVWVDGTITGYANVYNGRRTYWICKIAHTAATTNQPIISSDLANNNIFQGGGTPWWEDAWVSLWLKPNVLAGTIYGDNSGGSTCTADAVTGAKVCNDGALAPLYAEPLNVGHKLYAVGLINTWIRQGYISMMPQTWGAPQGGQNTAPGCKYGGNWVECGAMPITINRHISTAAMVN